MKRCVLGAFKVVPRGQKRSTQYTSLHSSHSLLVSKTSQWTILAGWAVNTMPTVQYLCFMRLIYIRTSSCLLGLFSSHFHLPLYISRRRFLSILVRKSAFATLNSVKSTSAVKPLPLQSARLPSQPTLCSIEGTSPLAIVQRFISGRQHASTLTIQKRCGPIARPSVPRSSSPSSFPAP